MPAKAATDAKATKTKVQSETKKIKHMIAWRVIAFLSLILVVAGAFVLAWWLV